MVALIVEDDPNSREILRAMLASGHPELTQVHHASNVKDAMVAIETHRPAVVFLDVELPDGTGFDILDQVTFLDFKVIFTTAFDFYAVRAFKVNATDYLLKPFSPDELDEAVAKALRQPLAAFDTPSVRHLLDFMKGGVSKKIALPMLHGFEYVEIATVIRCQAEGNYTRIILKGGIAHLVSRTLKTYEQLLVPEGFFRVHSAHLINLNEVRSYRKGEGGYVTMSDGVTVDVSRNRKHEFLSVFPH
jgi:two-component system LytT family response regulator